MIDGLWIPLAADALRRVRRLVTLSGLSLKYHFLVLLSVNFCGLGGGSLVVSFLALDSSCD
jgi:hypothetical protein